MKKRILSALLLALCLAGLTACAPRHGAPLTFEQSYSEVDGDSASMAELCA